MVRRPLVGQFTLAVDANVQAHCVVGSVGAVDRPLLKPSYTLVTLHRLKRNVARLATSASETEHLAICYCLAIAKSARSLSEQQSNAARNAADVCCKPS